MSTKRLFLIFTSILVLMVATIGVGLLFYFNQEKKEAMEIVGEYLAKSKINDRVKSQELVYDSKSGAYMIEIVFKDELDIIYEFYPEGGKIYDITAFDKDNVEITDKNKAKYIID